MKKQKEKNRSLYIVSSILIIFAIIYLIFNMLDSWHKYKESSKRLESSIQTFAELEGQYNQLKNTKLKEQSSTGYEAQIRSKFNMNKPEEKTVFIVSEETQVPIEEDKGIEKIFNTFKNFFN